jgi:hypothetical protein
MKLLWLNYLIKLYPFQSRKIIAKIYPMLSSHQRNQLLKNLYYKIKK